MNSDLPILEDVEWLSRAIRIVDWLLISFGIVLALLTLSRFILDSKKTDASERKAAPRQIQSGAVRTQLIEFIAPHKGSKIQITYVGGDAESMHFAQDLRFLFSQAGWDVDKGKGERAFGGTLPDREITIEHARGDMDEQVAAVLRLLTRLNCTASLNDGATEEGKLIIRVGLHP